MWCQAPQPHCGFAAGCPPGSAFPSTVPLPPAPGSTEELLFRAISAFVPKGHMSLQCEHPSRRHRVPQLAVTMCFLFKNPYAHFRTRSRLRTAVLWPSGPTRHRRSPATTASRRRQPAWDTQATVGHKTAWPRLVLTGHQQPRLEPPKTRLGCPKDVQEVEAVGVGKGLSCHSGFHTSRADDTGSPSPLRSTHRAPFAFLEVPRSKPVAGGLCQMGELKQRTG